MLGAWGIWGNERQVDGGCHRAWELDLGPLGSIPEPLQNGPVTLKIDALLQFELCNEVLDDLIIHIRSTQLGITGSWGHLKDTLTYVHYGDIEGSSSKVQNNYIVVLTLVQAIGKWCSGWFVDDPQNLQTCNGPCILCCLSLVVIKISWYCYHSLCDLLSKIGFCIPFYLLQDHGRYLRGRVGLVIDGHGIIGAHLPLDPGNRPLGIEHCLPLCRLSH